MSASTFQDTIAAIATPPGQGGIAIVRLSGPCAFSILQRSFCPAFAPERSCPFLSRRLYLGHALDSDGHPLDQVLAVYMPGPHSATGEDVAEIHCHGGPGIVAALLEALISRGARLAGPGEFTRRAFVNGRMDLTQAEAVAELVHAPSRQGARLAQAKLQGALGRKITKVRDRIDSLRAQAILAVDFPDEDLDATPEADFLAEIHAVRREIEALLAAFDRARLWREGLAAVLVGRVNAGKSSLLNVFLGRERAIVSAHPGTTRDYIEEDISFNGMPMRLIDTAGLRQSEDPTESEGIRRSRHLAAEADIILLVIDALVGPGEEENAFLQAHENQVRQGRVLVVLNKIDCCPKDPAAKALAQAAGLTDGALFALCPLLLVSAKTGEGIEPLALAMQKTAQKSALPPSSEDLAPNIRQAGLLKKVLTELNAMQLALAAGFPPDVLTAHLDSAALDLDEVTGASSNEDLLDKIFASFCIGK